MIQNYIKFEELSGDPVRIQILYERAVSRFPVSSDLWLGYTRYLDQNLKVLFRLIILNEYHDPIIILASHSISILGPHYSEKCIFKSHKKLHVGW